MTYFLLALFLGSLAGIIFMVGKKLIMVQDGQVLVPNKAEFFLNTEYLKEFKRTAIKNTKKHGYLLLVEIIRSYFRSVNFLKNKYSELKNKIKELCQRRQKNTHGEKRKENSFLKVISEYKDKIKKIKEQVEKEENI
jgi:hypothetical protein